MLFFLLLFCSCSSSLQDVLQRSMAYRVWLLSYSGSQSGVKYACKEINQWTNKGRKEGNIRKLVSLFIFALQCFFFFSVSVLKTLNCEVDRFNYVCSIWRLCSRQWITVVKLPIRNFYTETIKNKRRTECLNSFLGKKWRRLGDNWRSLNGFSNITFAGWNKFWKLMF